LTVRVTQRLEWRAAHGRAPTVDGTDRMAIELVRKVLVTITLM
jgi:hypothetical protein